MIWQTIVKFFCKELPLWAYGIECDICKMTFNNPEAHYKTVAKDKDLLNKHDGKIPILK